jgi:flagella basal body P-ring formation protein FlgA
MVLIASLMLAGIDPGECRVLTVAKQPSEEIFPADTAPEACQADGKPGAAWLVYDARNHVVRARSALPAGQDLGRVYFPPQPHIHAGERMVLNAHIGHVAISREVVALQDAGADQHVFVRDRDGQIFVIAASDGVRAR